MDDQPPSAPPPSAPPPPSSVPPSSVPPPSPTAPVWAWTPPPEQLGLTVGGLLRGAMRVYRRAFSSLFGVSLIQQAIQLLLLAPSILIAGQALTRVMDIFNRLNFRAGMTQSEILQVQQQLQDEMQAAVVPEPRLLIASTIASGLSVAITLTGIAVLTAIALAAIDERDDSIGGAVLAVFSRPTSFILPGIVLGLALALVSLPLGLSQSTLMASGRTVEGARVGAILSLFGLVIGMAVIYFAVRWSLAIPAMLAEGIGLFAGLSRSTELTRGIRLRIFLAVIALGLLILLVEIFGVVVALIAGLAASSITVGVATAFVFFVGLLVFIAPLIPGLTVIAYRDRVPTGPSA